MKKYNRKTVRLYDALAGDSVVKLLKITKNPKNFMPRAGDFFHLQIENIGFVLGRVIEPKTEQGYLDPRWHDEECERGQFDAPFVYLYKTIYDQPPPVPESDMIPELLIPPVNLSAVIWDNGLAKQIGNRPLSPNETLDQHCFWDDIAEEFHDERGRRVDSPTRPCYSSAVVLPLGLAGLLYRSIHHGFDQFGHDLA